MESWLTSFQEYWPAVLYQVIAGVSIALVGLRGDLRDFLLAHAQPRIAAMISSPWVWRIIFFLGIFVGPFVVFDSVRLERDKAIAKLEIAECLSLFNQFRDFCTESYCYVPIPPGGNIFPEGIDVLNKTFRDKFKERVLSQFRVFGAHGIETERGADYYGTLQSAGGYFLLMDDLQNGCSELKTKLRQAVDTQDALIEASP